MMYNLLAQVVPDLSLAGPLINLGAVGVCLIVMALWYKKKDCAYEKRIDHQLAREETFRHEVSELHDKYRKEASEMAEKYRLALEKFGQTLDAVLRMKQAKRDGGDS